MHRPASMLCVLSLLTAAACGEETPESTTTTTGEPSATTRSMAGSTSTTGGGDGGETTGGTTGTRTSGGTEGTTGDSTGTTDGTSGITGDTDGGATGGPDGGATGQATTTSGTANSDAGIEQDASMEAGQEVDAEAKLCSETHVAGGCDTEMIAACVCEGPAAGVEGEPSCCEPAVNDDDTQNGWDEVCQIIAYSEGCAGDCCEIHAEGSCELPSVEKCVCDALPECCMPADDSMVTHNGWDALCLAAAAACGAPCI